jgi:RNA polymerase sigma-70 factor (ECF subfamily)
VTEKPDTDKQLVKRCQNGDQLAYELLVKKYQFRIARSRYISIETEIEDISQEVFIKAYKALKNFRGDSEFYTWLYRIAVNTAKNHLSYKGRRKAEYGFDPQNNEESSYELSQMTDIQTPESLLAGKQMYTKLKQTIKEMPDELQEAIILREFDGLSYDEIAQAMDCPIGTVRSRIFRAREILDEVINTISTGK